MSRPFGVALLLAGYDDKGPQLFFSDPSGTFTQFKAKAIGACVRPPFLGSVLIK
jgi:20S proteasome subunit alpha 5